MGKGEQGGGSLGKQGVGGIHEAGEERAGSTMSEEARTGEKITKCYNIAYYFALEIA